MTNKIIRRTNSVGTFNIEAAANSLDDTAWYFFAAISAVISSLSTKFFKPSTTWSNGLSGGVTCIDNQQFEESFMWKKKFSKQSFDSIHRQTHYDKCEFGSSYGWLETNEISIWIQLRLSNWICWQLLFRISISTFLLSILDQLWRQSNYM